MDRIAKLAPIMLALAALIVGCSGGGGGGNPLPPGPPIVTPTATPTPVVTPTPASVQVTYPGAGGAQTVSITVQKSSNAGVTGTSECAYRATDSHHCDSTHPYATSGARAGVLGNYWVGPTNHVDNGTSFTDTYQLNQSSGGDLGMFALVSTGSATFLNLTAAGVNVSSTPSGTVQVPTASQVIGPSCSAPNNCSTLSSLGATLGDLEYGVFQPDEIVITTSGKAYPSIHSASPLFGTGTDVTTQGFASNGSNTMRAIPCANQTSGNPCNPNQANTLYSMGWLPTQSGSTWNTSFVNVAVGDLVGLPSGIGSQCFLMMIPPSAGATSGLLALDFTQVRVQTSSGSTIQTPSGITTPGVVCFSST